MSFDTVHQIDTIHTLRSVAQEAVTQTPDGRNAFGTILTQFGKIDYNLYPGETPSTGLRIYRDPDTQLCMTREGSFSFEQMIDFAFAPFFIKGNVMYYGEVGGPAVSIDLEGPLPPGVFSQENWAHRYPNGVVFLHPKESVLVLPSAQDGHVITIQEPCWKVLPDLDQNRVFYWSVYRVTPFTTETAYWLDKNFILNLTRTAVKYIRDGNFTLLSPEPPSGEIAQVGKDGTYTCEQEDAGHCCQVTLTAEVTQRAPKAWGLITHITHMTSERDPFLIMDMVKQSLVIVWPAPGVRETAWAIFHLSDDDLFTLAKIPPENRTGTWQDYASAYKPNTALLGDSTSIDMS